MSPSRRPAKSVLMIGPDPAQVGGMATVVRQMLGLDFAGSFDVSHQSVTVSSNPDETQFHRIRRHLKQVRETRDLLRSDRPAVLHLHTCSGFSFYRSALDAWLGRRCGSRVVLHVHGAAFDEFFLHAGDCMRRVIRWNLEAADRVIALSSRWASVLREIAPRARTVVIPNAVDIAVPPASPGGDGPCRFLLLAKMDEWKGIDDLLAASRLAKDQVVAMELVLAGPPGSAGDAQTLTRKIAEHGLADRVRYVGPVEGEDKAKWFAWANVYVQPSHHEGMPLSVLEAMARGLPVIATTVGALPEVIRDGREGRLIRPHQPDLLFSAMRELAADPNLRRRMGASGRQVVQQRFSRERLRDDLVLLYEEVCTEHQFSERRIIPSAARFQATAPGAG